MSTQQTSSQPKAVELLNRLLLIRSREELDHLLDSNRPEITRTFIHDAVIEVERLLKGGEEEAWHILPILEYAVNRLADPLLQGDLAALWAELIRKYATDNFVERYAIALEKYRSCGEIAIKETALCLLNLGLAHMQSGELGIAERHYLETVELARQHGLNETLVKAFTRLGQLAQLKGTFDIARHYFIDALEVCEKEGNHSGVITQLNHLGALLSLQSRVDEAEKLFRQAIDQAEKMGENRVLAMSLGNLSTTLQEQGRVNEAEDITHVCVPAN